MDQGDFKHQQEEELEVIAKEVEDVKPKEEVVDKVQEEVEDADGDEEEEEVSINEEACL